MVAAFAFIVAQTCISFLPPAQAPIEWFRNGALIARDEPVSTSPTERVYRRVAQGGGPIQSRTLRCTRVEGRSVLREQIGNGAATVLPMGMRAGASTRIAGASVRRVDRPADASPGSIWFSETRFDSRLIGVRAGVGIEEIRSLAVRGRADVQRAVVSTAPRIDANAVAQAERDAERVQRMAQQIDSLQRVQSVLRDSLANAQAESNALMRTLADTVRAMSATSLDRNNAALAAASKMLADSALRLPSEAAARAAAFNWPGAGHLTIGRGGTAWAVAGAIPVASALAAVVAPNQVFEDLGLDAETDRRAIIGGSAVAYLSMLFLSRAHLLGVLDDAAARGETRESFLRGAEVMLTPDGAVGISFRRRLP